MSANRSTGDDVSERAAAGGERFGMMILTPPRQRARQPTLAPSLSFSLPVRGVIQPPRPPHASMLSLVGSTPPIDRSIEIEAHRPAHLDERFGPCVMDSGSRRAGAAGFFFRSSRSQPPRRRETTAAAVAAGCHLAL